MIDLLKEWAAVAPAPQSHLCKIAIGGLMIVEAFHERLIARSRAVARP
jgi:hypothetical protein